MEPRERASGDVRVVLEHADGHKVQRPAFGGRALI